MADSGGNFINNQNLNEQNSLLESINPESENDVNPINHSTYIRTMNLTVFSDKIIVISVLSA